MWYNTSKILFERRDLRKMYVSDANGVEAKELIGVLMGEYKMTQLDVANWCGVARYLVSRWMNGLSNPCDRNLVKLREAVDRLEGVRVRYKGQALDFLIEGV